MRKANEMAGRERRWWRLYLLLGIFAAGAYFFLPSVAARNVLSLLIGMSAIAAIAVGVYIHRPGRPLPWYLFALSLVMFFAADAIWTFYENIRGVEPPFPSLADGLYIAGFPFMAVALLVIQKQRFGRDLAGVIDPVIIATGAGMLSWVFLMNPHADDQSLSLLQRLVSISYPLVDVLLLAVVARLLFSPGDRPPAYYLLSAGLVSTLIFDTVFAWRELMDTTGESAHAGWLLFFVFFFGAAALHPSMNALPGRPALDVGTRLTWRRLVLLAGATLMAPGALAIQSARGEDIDVAVIVGGSVVLFLLVLARVASLMRARERAANREKALREAGAALVTAADRESIHQAALDAALKLARDAPKAGASLAVGSPNEMTVAAIAGEHPQRTRGNRIELPKTVRAALMDGKPRECTGVTPLREALGVDGGVAETVFVVPLIAHGEGRGAIFLTSDSAFSVESAEGLEVLGTEVALAMESAALSEDLHRRRGEERFRSLVQNGTDVIMLVEADGLVRYASPSIERVLGYEPEDSVGGNYFESLHSDDVARTLSLFAESLGSPDLSASTEVRMRHQDGSWRYVEAVVQNLLQDPIVRAVVINSRDITERKAFEEQLRYQAFHDPLTKLPNRALFTDRLQHALSRAERHAGAVAVLFLDLDEFKVVNDSLGHEAGDELLVAVARRLRDCLRPEDTVARFGGDEFVLLLEDVDGTDDAERVAERIMRSLRTPFVIGDREMFITASIGVILGASNQDSPGELLRDADVALYSAKAAGKAGYAVFDAAMNTRALERLNLEADLRRAIEREEFAVYYQPKVELPAGKIVGLEALVRWEHPEKGLVSPARFIPVAEETGLILPIGRWVLREACRQAHEWREQRPDDILTTSVNLSAKQFQHPELVEEVEEILSETGMDPHALMLEITESMVMKDPGSSADMLRRMKGLGLKIAVDDFGTGYSSLSYLKRFPVDMLKIDKSFVDGLGEDPEDTAIVRAVIDLAHAQQLTVIAEGIETADQLRELEELGCEMGQGYYFAKPLQSHEAEELLTHNGS